MTKRKNLNFRFNWDRIKVFLAIYEAGSINGAADKLGIEQPSVSRALVALERELGVDLFVRHPRGVALTPEGREFHPFAEKMAKESHTVAIEVYEARNEPKGMLRLGVPLFLGSSWLPYNIKEFRRAYPDILLETRLGDGDALDLMLRKGLVDAIIRSGPTKLEYLIGPKIFEDKFVICTTEEYIAEFGEPKTLNDLDHHDLIAASNMLLRLGCLPGKERVAAIRPYDNSYGLLGAILDGNGIGILPGYIVPQYPKLVPILKHVELPCHGLYFCYPRELKKSIKIQKFREYIIQKIQTING